MNESRLPQKSRFFILYIEKPARDYFRTWRAMEDAYRDGKLKTIGALDLGYVGAAVKLFGPVFVRMCTGRKIHD